MRNCDSLVGGIDGEVNPVLINRVFSIFHESPNHGRLRLAISLGQQRDGESFAEVIYPDTGAVQIFKAGDIRAHQKVVVTVAGRLGPEAQAGIVVVEDTPLRPVTFMGAYYQLSLLNPEEHIGR